jgi:hypothetical protein
LRAESHPQGYRALTREDPLDVEPSWPALHEVVRKGQVLPAAEPGPPGLSGRGAARAAGSEARFSH